MRTMGVRAVVLLVAVALVPTSLEQDEDIPHNDVKNWALKFGAGLWEYSRYYTKIDEIKERYHNMDVEVARKDGLILIREMATEVKNMMDIKMNAVMRIMDSAEQVALSHKFEAGLKHRFLDARRFGEGAPGDSDPLLDASGDQGLNTTVSAILLPPGISDSNPDVMNAIKWSEQLDPLFVSNYEMDPSLSWQYFGSASGFLRRYPASRWPGGAGERPSDFRSAAWYAGAAASPKDVLVLLDSSGSMSGARREAAKAVVASILDMLGDDDFVNVYRFSDVTEELVPCFRDMLVQATRENIRELKNALEATKSENIANFSSALITAFELLHRYNRTGLGCQCNQAIALVTDGPSDTFSDIFKRYNEPHRPVRMFTFLVGGDSAGAKEMRTIACSNKGFYARVGSRKEAESAVLNMLYVMARPMVMYQNDHPVQWTPVYAGTRGSSSPGRSRGSSQLMTSVSAPIFDRRNYTGERVANLLGVVGTDVPVEHIQKLVQPYKLGVNGYSFIVDNNGHVLYHPDLRPLTKTPSGQEALKPDYNSVDLTEVELVDGEGGPRENNSLLLDLRHDMIDQKEGETELSVKIHYDNMKRVTTRRHKYFYNPIEGTPFSLGLAIPEGYGMYEVLGEQEIKLKPINVTDFFRGTKWKVHPDWVYCEYNYAAENRFKTPEEQVLYFLSRTRKPGWKWMSLRPRSQLKDAAHMKKMEKDSYFCDKTLVQSLVFDAVVTEGIESMERQVSSFSKDDPKTGDKKDELYGITLSFIATRSGLLRWQDYKPPGMSNDMPDPFPHFSENNQRATDEVWYKRAVDQYAIEPDSFVFSVPFDAGANSNTRVTATHALFVEHKGHRAPAAVVGLQFQHSTFASHFLKITSSCSSGQQNPSECKKTCNSEELDCYVLDDNGFIIVSESPDNTGRFFGQIDGTIMDSLVQDRIYKKVPVFDYQGACMDQKNPYSDASNRLTPLEPIKWFIRWFFGKMVWIAVQTSLYSLWDPSWAQANDDGNLYGDYETSFDNYPTREESSLFPAAGGILTETQPPLRMYPYTPVPPVHAPYTNDDNNDFQPRPCDKRVDLYILQPDRLNTSGDFNPLKGKLTNCHSTGCERPFSVQKIPQSNLILLVVDTLCPCGSKQLSIMPQEVAYDASTAAAGATGGCRNRPHEAMYRRRPPKCMNYHPEETEIKVCGGGGSTSVSPWIVMVCLGTWTISKALLS